MASPSRRFTTSLSPAKTRNSVASPSHRFTASHSPAKTRNFGANNVLKPKVVIKRTIVLKVALFDRESRSKALKFAVEIVGVQSARFLGTDKGLMEIVAKGIEAGQVSYLLGKKIGLAQIISVSSVQVKT
ncbi:uncharacterized protein [Euphorbia lathyris]|uniref:uncharacterized protein n=1 Tax=Euphorbia lathyris TaxID=212925 RepID=UPI003313C4FE